MAYGLSNPQVLAKMLSTAEAASLGPSQLNTNTPRIGVVREDEETFVVDVGTRSDNGIKPKIDQGKNKPYRALSLGF